MSEIAEKIAALDDEATESEDCFAPMEVNPRDILELIAHIRQQEAELTALRDQIKRADEQEPVAWQNTINGFIAKHQTAEYQIALVPKLSPEEPK